MKMSRISTAAVVVLATLASSYAYAAPQTAATTAVVLNTYSSVLVAGDALGPVQNGTPKLGQDTGAGIMDANFTFDHTVAAKASYGAEVLLGSVYTRSSNTPNNNNSYMQGGFVVAKLTETGVKVEGTPVDLPNLNGNRSFMRPLMAFTKNHILLIAASEDNGVNNNPQPVMFVANKLTRQLVAIPNSTRQQGGQPQINKPTNLIQQALKDGIQVQNPNNQRGPHSIVAVTDNSVVVGMQYNNQAAEAFRVTVNDDGSVKMNWVQRYSNTAQHCRPQVAIAEGATEGFLTEVEANEQPAEIGIRLTKFNIETGKLATPQSSKIIIPSDRKANLYVAEPSIGLVVDKVVIAYGLGSPVRNRNNQNEQGHTGGAKNPKLQLFNQSDLSPFGTALDNAAPYGRHSHIYTTGYGPNAEPAVAYIGGSSTGTKGGFAQLIPLKADGTLGEKDSLKLYPVSLFSDVANVQARGKHNPQDQAKGFINGLGNVPNPGYGKPGLVFMPEVKSFSFTTLTGYTDQAAATVGKRNSLWIALVPSSWKEGLTTVPGTPTDKPGSGENGLGPSPTTSTSSPTNPSGESGDGNNVLEGTEGTNDPGSRTALGTDNGSCSVSHAGGASGSTGLILLAVAGVIVALRRKQEEV